MPPGVPTPTDDEGPEPLVGSGFFTNDKAAVRASRRHPLHAQYTFPYCARVAYARTPAYPESEGARVGHSRAIIACVRAPTAPVEAAKHPR